MMMNSVPKYSFFLFVLFCTCSFSCTHKWDDHVGIADPASQKTLYDVIRAAPEFSGFMDLVDRSGYAGDLKSSRNFTVIVPTNEAIGEAKTAYDFNDSAVVRSFVGYHIINSVYNVNEASDTIRAKNLRNKYVEFTHGNFDGVPALKKNIVAANGLYHVVGTSLKPLANIYNLVSTTFPATAQVNNVLLMDTTSYQNWLSEIKRPMTTENSKYTYFVVDDDYFNAEYDRLRPFYHTHYDEAAGAPADSTTSFFTRKALLRDFIVAGAVTIGDQVTHLVSVSGTAFSIDPADILSRHKASNGVVYRVKKQLCSLQDRIREFKVMGNQPSGYKQSGKSGNIYFRVKKDTLGNLYNDVEIRGHGVSAFYAKYRAANANTVTYKVYGRAIMGLTGDPQTDDFTQYVHFFDPSIESVNEADLYKRPVVNDQGANDVRMPWSVTLLNHDEVYLGEVTQNEFGNMRLLVMANGTGPIILEYLRFVPVIQ